MRYIFLLVIVTMVSCKAQKENKAQESSDFVLLAKDDYSGIQEYETGVIRDQKSLNKFYSRVNKTRKPGLPVPIVDFSKEMLIVVCMGGRFGNPKLAITEESDSELNVALQLEPFPKSDVTTTVITSPFYVYKTALTAKKVSVNKEGW